MGFFNKYPYTDFHELNLDWVLQTVKLIGEKVDNFINFNSIKYADPLAWNITTQYAANTVVIDPATGIAYLSTQAVPSGVVITDQDYWTAIFDMSAFFADLGDINDLLTNDKTSVVNAINEVFTKLQYRYYATPQMYGAKADGVTDDTDAINQALAENKCVIIPESDQPYIFTGIIVNANNILKGAGGVLKFKDNTAVDSSVSYFPIDANGDNIVIDGLIIDGNSANNSQFTVCDAITAMGRNTTVRNCTIKDAPDSGIMFSKVIDGDCSNNVIDGARDCGIYVNSGSIGELSRCTITKNKITNAGVSAIACKRACSKSIISDNVIGDCTQGITLEQVAGLDYSTNIAINSNMLINIAERAINIRGGKNHAINGNTILNCIKYPILIQGCDDSVVVGNVITTSSTDPDSTGNAAIVITHHAPDVLTTKNINITGNTITINDTKNGGLRIVGDCQNVIFSNNNVTFNAVNTENFISTATYGGSVPTHVLAVNCTVIDVNDSDHDSARCELFSNITGNTRVFQLSNVATAGAILQKTSDNTPATGSVRIINPLRTLSSAQALTYLAGDIVPIYTTSNFKLYVAKADGLGSTVLTELASATF